MRTGMEWGPWFLELCQIVAKKSQCLSRKIGAVLVRDNSIISTGYNGPPRGVKTCDERWFVDKSLRKRAGLEEKLESLSEFRLITSDSDPKYEKALKYYRKNLEGKCPRYVSEFGFKSGQGLDICIAGHSERNALINAARNGIKTNNCKLYMNCGIPCTPCLIEIINAGIEEIIVTKIEYYDFSSKYLLEVSKLNYRVYEHLEE